MPTLRPRIVKPTPKPVASLGTRSSTRIRTPTKMLSPVIFASVSYN